MPAHRRAPSLTLSAYLDRWLALQRSSTKSPRTIESYDWAIRGWIVPAIGRRALSQLRVEDVEDLLLDMQRRGSAGNSITRVRSTLSMALDAAQRRRLVDQNVAALSIRPRGPRRQGRSMTPAQVRRLFEASQGHRLEAFVVTGILLGLRPGELAGLRWKNVDLRRRVLTIEESRLEEPDGMRLGPTKTTRSRRALEMPALVVSSLEVHRRRQEAERHKAGRRWKDQGLVFPNTVGTVYDRWALRRAFSALTEAAGLGSWSPKELRHTCVSLLSAAGVPLETIADVMGHANARVTGEIYRHPVHPTVAAARTAMDGLFGRRRS